MNFEKVVRNFIKAINVNDVEYILQHITNKHNFIDSLGKVIKGKNNLQNAWFCYFKMVPDYKITIKGLISKGKTVFVYGQASGTYTTDGKLKKANYWQCPAAWRAVVVKNKVKE